MPRLLVRDGSATRLVRRLFVRDGSTTREIKRLFVRDGTTARLVYVAAQITINNEGASAPNGFPATYQLNNNGTLTLTGQSPPNWVTPANTATAALFEVQFTNQMAQDATVIGSSFNTWLALSSSRNVTAQPQGGVAGTVSFDVAIRDAATQTVQDTATVSLNVSAV